TPNERTLSLSSLETQHIRSESCKAFTSKFFSNHLPQMGIFTPHFSASQTAKASTEVTNSTLYILTNLRPGPEKRSCLSQTNFKVLPFKALSSSIGHTSGFDRFKLKSLYAVIKNSGIIFLDF